MAEVSPSTKPLPATPLLLLTPFPKVTPTPENDCPPDDLPAAPPPRGFFKAKATSSSWWNSQLCWCSCLNLHDAPSGQRFRLSRGGGRLNVLSPSRSLSLSPILVLVLPPHVLVLDDMPCK